MIISHKHKFIFLHSRKCAGSSVTVSLSRYLGINDVQLGAVEDGLEYGITPPVRMALNAIKHAHYKFIISKFINKTPAWKLASDLNKRYYTKKFGKLPQHVSAKILEKYVPEWSEYNKFCVVRNPWDKTLSDYFWRVRNIKNPPSFDEYLSNLFSGKNLNGIVPMGHNNWDMYTINDEVCMDNIVRFENLSSDLTEILNNQLKIDWDGWMPNAKKINKTIRLNYREYYTKEQSLMLHDIYRKEIEHFGYKF
jgi:hypothetical protein